MPKEIEITHDGKRYGNVHLIAHLTGYSTQTIRHMAKPYGGARYASLQIGQRLFFPIEDVMEALVHEPPEQNYDDI